MLTENSPHAQVILNTAAANPNSAAHAYLFHGPDGTGKSESARKFAGQLLSFGANDPVSINERVISGVHPDLTWVTPSGAHELLRRDIDQAVVASANKTPFEAKKRVFVIEHVETMNDEAANRLLKTLEEPPPFVHLILLTNSLGKVLKTVSSRCQLVRFNPLSISKLTDELIDAGVNNQLARSSAKLALGSRLKAKLLASDRGDALRKSANNFAQLSCEDNLGNKPHLELLNQAKEYAQATIEPVQLDFTDELERLTGKDRTRRQREQNDSLRRLNRRAITAALDLQLELISIWYRDLLCLALNSPPDYILNSDQITELQLAAKKFNPNQLQNAVNLTEKTRGSLLLNVNEELLLEALSYQLASILTDVSDL